MPEEKSSKAAPAAAEKKAAAGSGSEDAKLFGALCYIIGILVPLFILATEKKNDKFLAFHAWQSLLLTVAYFVVFFVIGGISIVASMLTFFAGGIGGFIGCLIFPIALAVFCAVIFAAYKAYQGEMYKLPVFGDFAEKQVNK